MNFIYLQHSFTGNYVNPAQCQKMRHHCLGSAVFFHVPYAVSLPEQKLLKVRRHFYQLISFFSSRVLQREGSLGFVRNKPLIPRDQQVTIKMSPVQARKEPTVGNSEASAVRSKRAEMMCFPFATLGVPVHPVLHVVDAKLRKYFSEC